MAKYQTKIWGLIPAAGVGKRFGGNKPKQYLALGGRTVVEHSIERLCGCPSIHGNVIGIAAEDKDWNGLQYANDKLLGVFPGGAERAQTVLNGLNALIDLGAEPDDWVLVHDAARPCVHPDDIENLIDKVSLKHRCGLLAAPVVDTVKRANDDFQVEKTVARDGLWRALTPQMATVGILQHALQSCREKGVTPTDEANALELYGFHPILVEGRMDNIKITLPEDLKIAEAILQYQKESAERCCV